jgi:hypothetical protein
VGIFGEVALAVLMERKEAKYVGSRAVVRHGAFLDPGDSRSVVAKGSNNALTAVSEFREDVLVAENAVEFQDGIGKGAIGMGKLAKSAWMWLGKGSRPTKGGGVSDYTVLGDGGTPPMP